jgi:tetratricopeptide (TPR) repeat protein
MIAEFPELDRDRVRVAVERAIAKAQAARLDTEGYQVVNLHLQRVEATEEATERAKILRELSGTLEERGDADRALVTRLAAFGEVPSPDDVEPLLRLAKITDRWDELPLDPMTALVDALQDGAAKKLTELATAWQKVDRPYQAADCLERVLVIEPKNDAAFEALEVFYRATQEWPVLIDLIGRRAVQVDSDKERAELFREMAVIYERELHDDAAALERSATVIGDAKERARQLTRAAELAKLTSWDKAQGLYERALKDDPTYVTAIDGYIGLLRDRGQLADAITALVNSAERVSSERARWLTDAGDYCVALGDTDWAKQLYRDARAADPNNLRAAAAIVELSADSGDLAEIAPILDELCRKTEDPVRLRGYLLQRSKVAAQLGDQTGARIALSSSTPTTSCRAASSPTCCSRRSSGSRRARSTRACWSTRTCCRRAPRPSCTSASRGARRSSATSRRRRSTSGSRSRSSPRTARRCCSMPSSRPTIRPRSSQPPISPRQRSARAGSPRSATATASSATVPLPARCTARRSRTGRATTCC